MNEKGVHMNTGGISLVMLLIVFALTVFAVLSMRASYQELQMAEKNKNFVEGYYEADTRMEELYQFISEGLQEAALQSDVSTEIYFKTLITKREELSFDENSYILTCIVPMKYNMHIETKVRISEDFTGILQVMSQKMQVAEP